MLSPEQIHHAAQVLAQARRNGTQITDLDADLRPGSVSEAYAIQYEIAKSFGSIGGWKVGLPKADEEPRATPIPGLHVIPSGGHWPATGPTRIEVELALKMRTPLPKRASPYRRAEVIQAIRSAHVAFELLGARFVDKKLVSALTLLADGQSNAGLVVGGVIPNWSSLQLTTLDMTLKVDDAIVQKSEGGPSFDRTLDAVVWLANHAAEHVGGLQAGQVILTGARIGPTAVPTQRRIAAEAAGVATVSASLG
jgi:2-keto-4-pentenoate hydratase